MDTSLNESHYPISFRHEDAVALGACLKIRHPVELIGMKRVGISNFLRFFITRKDIIPTYIDDKKHLLIPVDLQDLVEREVFPFWMLTFKRLCDRCEQYPVSPKTKRLISNLFLSAIQSKDLFLAVENLRQALVELTREDVLPTFFFIRFDRLENSATTELMSNLSGIRSATGQKVSYVFTSFRPITQLLPNAFPKNSFMLDTLYFKPAKKDDSKIIFETFEKRYQTSPSKEIFNKILDLSQGHVQYLQLALIVLHQTIKDGKINLSTITDSVIRDERINLLSEEIWESLKVDEKNILTKIHNKENSNEPDLKSGKYLFDSGIITSGKNPTIFSPLFEQHIHNKPQSTQEHTSVDLTKKENLLYACLKENLNIVCERDKIITAVWPEYEEFGVSDWTIDRLVARLRTKLKTQNSTFSIVTVKTRGYKMIEGGTRSDS